MIVRAISNLGYDLPYDCKDARMGIDDETEFAVTVGKDYVVYAMTILLNYPWYYICTDDAVPYPKWTPAPLFEVIDGQISQYWEYGYRRGELAADAYAIFAFFEWVRDKDFYDRLTDGDETAVAEYRHYKELIDREHELR